MPSRARVMEAVWIRQKGAVDFAAYYESLCALESICPVSSIRTSAKDGRVNCKCDRLRRADWHPLLNALRINKSLNVVCFHTKWQQCYVSGKTARGSGYCVRTRVRDTVWWD